MAEKKLLRPKYIVKKIGEEPIPEYLSTNPDDIDSPFVLMPRKDPAAFVAMLTYCQYCEPQLRSEIVQWLLRIAEAPPQLGTQGTRNWAAGRVRSVLEA